MTRPGRLTPFFDSDFKQPLSGIPPRSRGVDLPESCINPFAQGRDKRQRLRGEGAGNARRSDRARSLACKIKRAYECSHHGHAGFARHSPRNGFNGFLRALPGEPGFVATIPSATRKRCRRVDPSVGGSGPHDFAVRDATSFVFDVAASTASRLYVRDDRPNAPLVRWDGAGL
jgi:hypothetical protein